MKLTKISYQLKTQLLTKFLSNDIYVKSLISISILSVIALAVWLGGEYISWQNYAPLAQPEKRIYVILFLFLAWILKLLLIDLGTVKLFNVRSTPTEKKLTEIKKHFEGAFSFLKKATVAKHGKVLHLNQLPLHLLIGPSNAGKTSLLAYSGVNFILQKQFQNSNSGNIETSEKCDWWLTRDAAIIDVPSKYLSLVKNAKQAKTASALFWDYSLRLIKKYYGKNKIDSILIALPLPELMQDSDSKRYQDMLHNLFHRISELRKYFPQAIPCQLIITKCDLIHGFNEFFAESTNDEIIQAWGINIPALKKDKLPALIADRFNALIKKLNQQLIWRLHHERDITNRPGIKDFPLQVELLKDSILGFIKKFLATNNNLSLQGVYLTSALQKEPENTGYIFDENNQQRNSLQVFKQPLTQTRAYFIKQLLSHGLLNTKIVSPSPHSYHRWKRYLANAASISIIVVAAFLLGRDFISGIKYTYSIQGQLADYQLEVQKIENPDEHLINTLDVLNPLQAASKKSGFKLNLKHLLSFYSHQSEQKAGLLYEQALQNLLIPEIKDYLADYIKNPVNRNAEYTYAAFKAYLMLGDNQHFDVTYLTNTLQEILPKSIDNSRIQQLNNHLNVAFKTNWSPQILDTNLIQNTRNYFIAMPSFQLGYVILKNINDNNLESEINIGTMAQNSVFTSQHILNQIPNMFTVRAFNIILSQEIGLAAQEALQGNWVLGAQTIPNKDEQSTTALIEQLRTAYINNYVDVWESLLSNIRLSTPSDLKEIDKMITNMMSNNSPILQLLRTIHENTYFEPITTSSPKLQGLGSLIDNKPQSENLLYQIFAGLQSVHQYIQTVLIAENEKQAAFLLVSKRMQHQGNIDAITQLRLIAEKSPEPIKSWLNKLADHTWRILVQDAGHYLDVSWHDQVIKIYQAQVVNKYPFTLNTENEISIQQFTDFFGNPGTLLTFFNNYLQTFIDTTTPKWRWRVLDNVRLPFTDDTLNHIQQAMRIHQTFFPNGDNKLFVEFALQPYELGKAIKSVQLNINDKQFLDERDKQIRKLANNTMHMLVWPNNESLKMTSIQFTLNNNQVIKHDFPGDWGWFKLINQAFESAISKKEVLVNFSMNKQPAKYLLFANGKMNPFTSLNLRHFYLPLNLSNQKI